jgi:photosystem II stability/assembly factor-like uncharacterized protein
MKVRLNILASFILVFIFFNHGDAQWKKANGPYGRGIDLFYVSGNNIFTLTSDSIYLSTDNARTWTSISKGIAPPGNGFLSFDAIGHHLFVIDNGGGHYHSKDNGLTWSKYIDSISGAPIWNFASIDSNLFAGTYGAGVFCSKDSGTTWTAVNSGLKNLHVGKIYSYGKNLIAVNDSGYFRSTSYGTSWTQLQTGGCINITGSDSILLGSGNGMYQSTDTGKSWNKIGNIKNPKIFALHGSHILVSTDIIMGGRTYYSTNNGTQWTDVCNGITNRNISAVALTDSILFIGTANGGIYRSSNNGVTWAEANNGIAATYPLPIKSLALNGGNLFAGTDGGGIFRSSDKGSNWKEINTGLELKHVISLASHGTKIFAGTIFGNIFRSDNEGENWTLVNNGLPSDSTLPSYELPLLLKLPLTFCDTTLFASISYSTGGIFRSTNYGTSWVPVSTGSVSCFTTSDTIIYGGGGGVFHMTESGSTWFADTNGLPVNGANVSALAIHDSIVFAGNYNDGVYTSSIHESTWKAANTGLPQIYPSVGCMVAAGKYVFTFLYNGGMYYSSNDGATWNSVASAFPFDEVYTLLADSTNIYAGMFGSIATEGIYYHPISALITSVSDNGRQVPSRFSLSQNYPNPFNPSTVIGYQLAVNGSVSLKVFDVLGREVTTLVNARQTAGSHQATFNASNFPSGIYFYRLQAEGFSETRKLILLK